MKNAKILAMIVSIFCLIPAAHSTVQSIINAACPAPNTVPGVATLSPAGNYSVSGTVTLPSNCALILNNSTITWTGSSSGDLISSTKTSNSRIEGPGTLDNSEASGSPQSHTIEFFGVNNSSVTDLTITGSAQACLVLWGVSNMRVRNVSCSNYSHARGAKSPGFNIYNGDGRNVPTSTVSADVQVDGIVCDENPNGGGACLFADGNNRHSCAAPCSQANLRIKVSGTNVIYAEDDGVEFDHTIGSISQTHCGANAVHHQCVLIRQSSQDVVSGTTCEAGNVYCVEVARFLSTDDLVDNIVVSGTAANGTTKEGILVSNAPSGSMTNIVIDRASIEGSMTSDGVRFAAPGPSSTFRHFVLNGVVSRNNQKSGILLRYAQDVRVSASEGSDNGQGNTIPCGGTIQQNYTSALYISNSSDVVVTGFRGFDDQAMMTQCFGLTVDATSSRVTVRESDLRNDRERSGIGVHDAGRNDSISYRSSPKF